MLGASLRHDLIHPSVAISLREMTPLAERADYTIRAQHAAFELRKATARFVKQLRIGNRNALPIGNARNRAAENFVQIRSRQRAVGRGQ